MEREMRKDTGDTTVNANAPEGIIVSHLLHPTTHFDHPRDVLAAAHLSEEHGPKDLPTL
jgi:hypothetical protein